MKLKVSTVVLQTMVSKVIKGVKQNKMIPLTNIMCVELKDNVLRVIASDSSNFMYIYTENVEGNDFYMTVQIETFAKLVSKLTTAEVELRIEDDVLIVSGNGEYKIELPLNEDGELIKYPDPYAKFNVDTPCDTISSATVQTMLNTSKSALCVSEEFDCYRGYYIGDRIITTDTLRICGIDEAVLDTPILLSPTVVDMLGNIYEADIDVYRDGDIIVFKSKTCIVYGRCMSSIDDFQADVISSLLDETFDYECKVSRTIMLQILDRLSLFVSDIDKNAITLTFTRDGIMITSKQTTGAEMIPYLESENFNDFTCSIDVGMLHDQIKSLVSESITIQYGKENLIKLIDEDIIQVIALLTEE